MGRMTDRDFQNIKRNVEGFLYNYHTAPEAMRGIIAHVEAIELELKISKEDEQRALDAMNRLMDNVAQLSSEKNELQERIATKDETIEAYQKQNKELRGDKKVPLPQEHIDVIKWARGVDGKDERILQRFFLTGQFAGENTNKLRAIPFDKLFQALANGYTVEKTKEDRLREGLKATYDDWSESPSTYDTERDKRDLVERLTDFVTKFNAEN